MSAVSAPDLPNEEEHAWSHLLGGTSSSTSTSIANNTATAAATTAANNRNVLPPPPPPFLIKVDSAPSATTIASGPAAAATADRKQSAGSVGAGGGRVSISIDGVGLAEGLDVGLGGLGGLGAAPPSTTASTAGAQMGERKPSFIHSFNRHMRSSFRAVSDSPGAIQRYRQTRYSNRRVRKRVIFKHGDCNVVQGNVAKRRRRYMQWRWTLGVFAMSFILTWTIFAVVWWTIAYGHGDFEYMQQLRSGQLQSDHDLTHIPCVTEIKGFFTCFLFSVETQHTIGYGNRYITDECPEAIFTMCLQCIVGVFIQAFMVGIVFAKLARPIKRAQTLLFSRNAVICHRDGVPCLMFRVGDMRKSHIIEAHVRAQIIRKKVTQEGEVLPFFQQELSIGADGGQDRLMFIWPTTMLHKIDRHSPLYALSAQDMLRERFEIVVMLEGVVESTGMTTQARSSYLPTEILWGHRFEHVVTFRKDSGEYEVDYTLFNNTYEVDTPLCSSKQLDEVRAELHMPNGLERLCSAGLLPRVSSAASIDLPSDESAESIGRLQMRTIPPSSSGEQQQPAHHAHFYHPEPASHHHHNHLYQPMQMPHDGHLPNSSHYPAHLSLDPSNQSMHQHQQQQHQQQHNHPHQHHNHLPHNQSQQQMPRVGSNSNNRRLSIRHDQLSIDSMC